MNPRRMILHMISKRLYTVLAILLVSNVVIGPLRAESVGFPKDHPVFTIEVPKDWKAMFDSNTSLSIKCISERGFIITEMSSVHDKDSARKFLEGFIKYICQGKGATDVEQTPVLERPLTKNIAGLEISCSGNVFAGLEKASIEYSMTAFSLDGKRFFSISGFGFSGSVDQRRIEESIKAAK